MNRRGVGGTPNAGRQVARGLRAVPPPGRQSTEGIDDVDLPTANLPREGSARPGDDEDDEYGGDAA